MWYISPTFLRLNPEDEYNFCVPVLISIWTSMTTFSHFILHVVIRSSEKR